jgi:hypothetical protein
MLNEIDFVVQLQPLSGASPSPRSSLYSHDRHYSADGFPYLTSGGPEGVPFDERCSQYAFDPAPVSDLGTDDGHQSTVSSPCPRRFDSRQRSSLARYSIDHSRFVRQSRVSDLRSSVDESAEFEEEEEDAPMSTEESGRGGGGGGGGNSRQAAEGRRRHRVGMSDDYYSYRDPRAFTRQQTSVRAGGDSKESEWSSTRHEDGPAPSVLGASQNSMHSSELSIISSSSIQSSPCPRRGGKPTKSMMLTGNHRLRANNGPLMMAPGFRFPATSGQPQDIVAYRQGNV